MERNESNRMKNITTIKEFYLLPGDELTIHITNTSGPIKLFLGKSEIDRENINNFETNL